MNETEIIDVTRQALMLTIQISLPVMMVGLLVGVSIALIQALTQVQEMTLVFVPKIVAIFVSLIFFLPWMANILIVFTQSLADRIVSGGG
jgi:flagellar biosynthetic protein FliQ